MFLNPGTIKEDGDPLPSSGHLTDQYGRQLIRLQRYTNKKDSLTPDAVMATSESEERTTTHSAGSSDSGLDEDGTTSRVKWHSREGGGLRGLL